MNDNEKLDNQRLKNFKNKGRDLEVSTLKSFLFSAVLRYSATTGSAVTSFTIIGDFHFYSVSRRCVLVFTATCLCAKRV